MQRLDRLALADPDTITDLRTLLGRARTVQDGEVALVARGQALAVYVPALVPEGLGSGTPTVLGMRAFRLAESAEGTWVFPLGAVTDRLARMSPLDTVLQLPPAETPASWAGVLPPIGSWEDLGEYDAEALRAVAESGMRAVAEALPANSGRPVVASVRSRVWAAPCELKPVPELPAGAAFAAQTLGFLPPAGPVKVLRSGLWHRLSTAAGQVLVRQGAAL
ncbi:hypothetical protein [Zhihengliuella sp.]|uniref:hypothetical protein n=1 Tax=Zhihengliuella sp. TaxID=1954483 RepID=UPI0028119B81|nr:hypothetical protein [Zhihengliuella sp.]